MNLAERFDDELDQPQKQFRRIGDTVEQEIEAARIIELEEDETPKDNTAKREDPLVNK